MHNLVPEKAMNEQMLEKQKLWSEVAVADYM